MKIKLLLISLLIYGNVNAYEIQNDFSEQMLPEGAEKVNYKIKVFKDDKIFYQGSMTLENSKITPIFYLKNSLNKNEINEKAQVSSETGTSFEGKKENQKESEEQTQLRVAIHIDRNNNDFKSQLFLQDIILNKTEEITTGKVKSEDKIAKAESNPIIEKIDKELIVAHQNKQQATISWKNYNFILEASIKENKINNFEVPKKSLKKLNNFSINN